MEITVKMVHDKEVNRARYCPKNPFIIATKSPCADVLVYDYSKHPSKPKDATAVVPQLRLKGHEKEGYGLSWSPFEANKLVSAGDDHLVCLFDIEHGPTMDGSAGGQPQKGARGRACASGTGERRAQPREGCAARVRGVEGWWRVRRSGSTGTLVAKRACGRWRRPRRASCGPLCT